MTAVAGWIFEDSLIRFLTAAVIHAELSGG